MEPFGRPYTPPAPTPEEAAATRNQLARVIADFDTPENRRKQDEMSTLLHSIEDRLFGQRLAIPPELRDQFEIRSEFKDGRFTIGWVPKGG